MVIVSIRQTSPGRLTLGFEDGSEIKSTLGVVTELRLFQGRDESDDDIAEIKRASSLALARERALELLSRRLMSRRELTDKLCAKGEDEDTAALCADWLEENGFLNDESYAAAVARHYAAKGYGAGRIRTQLSRRGVSRELWEDAAEAAPPADDKIDKFISARLKDPEDKDAVRKVGAALYRRGFSWDEIRRALARHGESIEE